MSAITQITSGNGLFLLTSLFPDSSGESGENGAAISQSPVALCPSSPTPPVVAAAPAVSPCPVPTSIAAGTAPTANGSAVAAVMAVSSEPPSTIVTASTTATTTTATPGASATVSPVLPPADGEPHSPHDRHASSDDESDEEGDGDGDGDGNKSEDGPSSGSEGSTHPAGGESGGDGVTTEIVCRQYKFYGLCRWGDRCRFTHVPHDGPLPKKKRNKGDLRGQRRRRNERKRLIDSNEKFNRACPAPAGCNYLLVKPSSPATTAAPSPASPPVLGASPAASSIASPLSSSKKSPSPVSSSTSPSVSSKTSSPSTSRHSTPLAGKRSLSLSAPLLPPAVATSGSTPVTASPPTSLLPSTSSSLSSSSTSSSSGSPLLFAQQSQSQVTVQPNQNSQHNNNNVPHGNPHTNQLLVSKRSPRVAPADHTTFSPRHISQQPAEPHHYKPSNHSKQHHQYQSHQYQPQLHHQHHQPRESFSPSQSYGYGPVLSSRFRSYSSAPLASAQHQQHHQHSYPQNHQQPASFVPPTLQSYGGNSALSSMGRYPSRVAAHH